MRRLLRRNIERLLTWSQGALLGGGITPPSIADTTKAATVTNGTLLVVPPPAGLSAGHIWLIVFGTDSAENVATPAGFSRGAETDDLLAEQPTAVVFYKTAGASESSANVTWGTLEHAVAYSIAIADGVYDTSTADNDSANTPTLASPAITVAENGSIVLEFGIGDDTNPSDGTFTATPSGADVGEAIIRSGPETGGVFIEGKYHGEDKGPATVGSWTISVARPKSTISVSISPV